MDVLNTSLSETTALRSTRALASAVKKLYAGGKTDYYLDPIVLEAVDGTAIGRVCDGDAVVFCCRRGEREIQLTEAFTDPALDKFPRKKFSNLPFVILTLYHDKFKDLPVAFAPSKVQDTLGELVSRAGLTQSRISESEKFAHVTFFFNGGNGNAFPGEQDIKIPSLRGVPFDQYPELSLAEVSEKVIGEIRKSTDLVITNFANGDVIGHTSNTDAKIQCVEFVDRHMGEVIETARSAGYVILITADHGNIEETLTSEGSAHVSHTTNPVPFFIIDPLSERPIVPNPGRLADIAPTILQILDIEKSALMTGTSLVSQHDFGGQRKALLIILDGWGISPRTEQDPITIGQTPNWDNLLQEYPSAQLEASGESVGLKDGKSGNSEAGHINIGAGRVILQDDVRLDMAMKDGSFYKNEVILREINGVKERGTALHLIGLLTEKSSHGSIDYPLAVLKMARDAGLDKVYLHMIFDGRSTEPGSAPALLEKLGSMVDEIGAGQIVTGIGRGIALDRDGNYQKTQRAYDALVDGNGMRVSA
jgi:2,3-bisphosphoglycerate-independent phosphoglycerate mutase